jgi:hypothetical protein
MAGLISRESVRALALYRLLSLVVGGQPLNAGDRVYALERDEPQDGV